MPLGNKGVEILARKQSSLNVAVDAVGGRPIRFHRNCREALFFNQPLRDLRARLIEIVGSMRGFAEKYELVVANQIHEAIVVSQRTSDSFSM